MAIQSNGTGNGRRRMLVAPGRHFAMRRIQDAVLRADAPRSLDEVVIYSAQPRTRVQIVLERMVKGGLLTVEYDGSGQRCYAPRR